MKILVYTDVHGNVTSLMNLIKTKDYQTSDIKISLGDTIVDYSHPNEAIRFINENAISIMGNNDSFVCDHIPSQGLINFSIRKQTQIKFMSRLVTDENKQIVMSWPKELYLQLGKYKAYFCHYHWISDDDVDDEPKEKNFETREKMFGHIDADYIFFGHEHDPNHFDKNDKHYYCVGSLGLRNPAYYVTIDLDDNGEISVVEHEIVSALEDEDQQEIVLRENNIDLYHL